MTRLARWSLVAVACAAIGVAGTATGRTFVLRLGWPLMRLPLAVQLPRIPAGAMLPAGEAAGAALVLGLLILVWRRRVRRRDRARLVCRLNERGFAIPAIARETRLSQDAVRDAIDAATLAGHAGAMGRKFRLSRVDPPSFADVLAQTGARPTP